MTKREFNGKIYFAVTQAYFYFLLLKTCQTDHYWTEETLKDDIYSNFKDVVSCKLYGDNLERSKKNYTYTIEIF